MPRSTEFQPIAQPQQANQLLYCKTAEAKPEQFVCTTEAAIAPSFPQSDIATLAQTGGIPAAIILSIAFLILVLAEYNKVFLPVMLQKPEEKNE
jgi:hypothetical protein